MGKHVKGLPRKLKKKIKKGYKDMKKDIKDQINNGFEFLARAITDYSPESSDEVRLSKGDELSIFGEASCDWYWGYNITTGQNGWIHGFCFDCHEACEETYELELADECAIKNYHGKYHTAIDDNDTFRHARHIQSWEIYEVVVHGDDKLSFKSVHGTYLMAHENGSVCQSGNCSGWEAFRIEHLEGSVVALKTHHGTYLSANQDGTLSQARKVRGWEKFKLLWLNVGEKDDKAKKKQKEKRKQFK